MERPPSVNRSACVTPPAGRGWGQRGLHGEFLGELKAIEQSVAAWLEAKLQSNPPIRLWLRPVKTRSPARRHAQPGVLGVRRKNQARSNDAHRKSASRPAVGSGTTLNEISATVT
jgi:hypothetical protein